MAVNPAAFAKEFGDSLIQYGDGGNGQWFGRLVAYGYNVSGFRGKDYTEEEFRAKMDNKEIQIKTFKVEDNPTVSIHPADDHPLSYTVKGIVKIAGTADGENFDETIQFTQIIQPALQSLRTTFASIAAGGENPPMADGGNLPAAVTDGSGVEIPLHALTQTSPTHEWDDPKFSWFIWQYSRSLEIYSNGQWFGRLTDGGYTVNILGQDVTKAAIVQSFGNNTAAILFTIDPATVKYTDHGNGTATAVCQAKIGGNIGGVNIPDGLYTLTHQIRSTPSARTPWVADSSTIA